MSVIVKYPELLVREFLESTYGLTGGVLAETTHGLDNSVYFINGARRGSIEGDFVLKIVETKSRCEIEGSIAIVTNMARNFSHQVFFAGNDGHSVVTEFGADQKPAVLSTRVPGDHIDVGVNASGHDYAAFISDFHCSQPSTRDRRMGFARHEIARIEEYWTTQLIAGVTRHTPARLPAYERWIAQALPLKDLYLKDAEDHLPSRIGLTHGDLNPGNVIVMPDHHLSGIDFDGAKRSGFQLLDVFQAAGKSSIGSSVSAIREFLAAYHARSSSDFDHAAENSSIRWLNILCIRAALSTEYYTHVIPKLSPEWNIEHAGSVIDRLVETVRETAGFLLPAHKLN